MCRFKQNGKCAYLSWYFYCQNKPYPARNTQPNAVCDNCEVAHAQLSAFPKYRIKDHHIEPMPQVYAWYDRAAKQAYPCRSLTHAWAETKNMSNVGIAKFFHGEWIPIWERISNWQKPNGYAVPGIL